MTAWSLSLRKQDALWPKPPGISLLSLGAYSFNIGFCLGTTSIGRIINIFGIIISVVAVTI